MSPGPGLWRPLAVPRPLWEEEKENTLQLVARRAECQTALQTAARVGHLTLGRTVQAETSYGKRRFGQKVATRQIFPPRHRPLDTAGAEVASDKWTDFRRAKFLPRRPAVAPQGRDSDLWPSPLAVAGLSRRIKFKSLGGGRPNEAGAHLLLPRYLSH